MYLGDMNCKYNHFLTYGTDFNMLYNIELWPIITK